MSTAPVYQTATWRGLPRNSCAIHILLGTECAGAIARHHVRPVSSGGDPYGRTISVCARHHPQLEALARRVWGERWKTCRHHHRSREAREACEKRLNGVVV